MQPPHPENPVDPFAAGFSAALNDLRAADVRSESLRLTANAKHFDEITRLTVLKSLWCFNINQKQLELLTRLQTLERLYINGSTSNTLQPLRNLPKLHLVSLDSFQKIRTLDEVACMSSLRALAVADCKKINDLSPLVELKNLTTLAVTGGMLSTQKVQSLRPLSSLAHLVFLDLTALKPAELSLAPLHTLKNLKLLRIANVYPTEEFGRLSIALPDAHCAWFAPHVCLENIPCKQCGKHSLVMLTGGKAGTACKTCDHERIERHVLRFEAARR